MKQIWSGIQIAFTAFGGFLGWFLGGVDGFLYALIAFTVIDYITGVMCAITDKNLSSSIGFKGICRKVLISLWWVSATLWMSMSSARVECCEPQSFSSTCPMRVSAFWRTLPIWDCLSLKS